MPTTVRFKVLYVSVYVYHIYILCVCVMFVIVAVLVSVEVDCFGILFRFGLTSMYGSLL